jgi:hydrogenase/urease accessory protein HupE
VAARRALSAALGTALALAWGSVAPARAHPLAPSLLELRETPAGLDFVWKQALLQPAGSALEPMLPEPCALHQPPRVERDATSVTLRGSADCGGAGLVGARVGVRGLAAAAGAVLLRVELADGRQLRAVLDAERPELSVPARERRLDVFADYLGLGFRHILGGADHLLFVLGLLLLVRGRRALLLAVSAFTLGHSLTLSLAVLGFLGIPPDWAELAIAASILALAVALAEGGASPLARRPWLAAGGFGLLHGLGFAGALARVGLPDGEIPLALVSFNAGIEAGQLAFVAGVLGVGAALGARRAPAWLRRVPAYAIGSIAAFWCFERAARLL